MGLKNKENCIQQSFLLPVSLSEEIEVIIKEEGIKKSTWLRNAVEEKLSNDENKKDTLEKMQEDIENLTKLVSSQTNKEGSTS